MLKYHKAINNYLAHIILKHHRVRGKSVISIFLKCFQYYFGILPILQGKLKITKVKYDCRLRRHVVEDTQMFYRWCPIL